ncbi:lytic transglycosylase domain-containing protein [Sphingomonas sabuli]|uniref:Lytic transglycosylase domain-containing protein n=1 Tax=Sphingomonas sabuli TaxID=2764186 RepID=A0A7G9L448_9SPHN|nr:lytic transglycosylase domain-containing protein [Sphingomonas sabuli]QNM83397.1 lytic transglycosylase domain-containing protein [Sphingomonas sabuli]
MTISAILLTAAAAAQPVSDPLAPLPQARPAPIAAQPIPVAPTPYPVIGQPQPYVPVAPPIVVPRDWRGVFAAIRGGRWLEAQAGISALPPSVLTPVAKAELYTARNSPTVDLPRLQMLLAEAPDLPNADQLSRMAVTRGALTPPSIIPARRTIGLGSAPTRYRAKPVSGEPLADALRAQLDDYVKANDGPNAEAVFLGQAPYLSANARAEAAQRVAWTYYSRNDDFNARRVADYWRQGAGPEWGSQAAWVSALAAWRMNDCNAASRAFKEVASTAVQRELSAGGYYWAARAEQMCRRPQSVQGLLKAAAASPESFYGLIARETLGTETRLPRSAPVSTAQVENYGNIRRAVELARIGETALAEQMLRHQAKIGSPADHGAILEIAKRLHLAGAQYWLGTNGQSGARVAAADRYPMPAWAPAGGWRVEPALAFAHITQESNWRSGVVSPAGAVGLMQVMPGTAASLARSNGLGYSSSTLYDPTQNMEYGQSYIEKMRASSYTGGQLPKVIASYNAGPLPVGRWAAIPDRGDPLLWIESVPYWETRYYIPAVMRNLWVYEGLKGRDSESLKAVVQHRWPAVPGASAR